MENPNELPFELPENVVDLSQVVKESQIIKIYLERRKRHLVTVIEGINEKDFDLYELAKLLKTKCATGGTVKNSKIELQGDQRRKVKEILVSLGFNEENIQIL
ncbi:MAG: stress response translation initiation inhibitor YciH [bacterium]|nr:stress response translation initiation inhibitor YciH [bacterium]